MITITFKSFLSVSDNSCLTRNLFLYLGKQKFTITIQFAFSKQFFNNNITAKKRHDEMDQIQ